MTNESSAKVIIAFLQTRVHTYHDMVTTMSRCLECSVYHKVQDISDHLQPVVCTQARAQGGVRLNPPSPRPCPLSDDHFQL